MIPDVHRAKIEEFFTALLTNDVDTCENLSQELTTRAKQDSTYDNLAKYFVAVLAEEKDNNWEFAEATYSTLLARPNLDSFLRGQVLLSISNFYLRHGLWLEIVESAKKALTIFVHLDEPLERAKAELRIAHAYIHGFQHGEFDDGDLSKAARHSEQSIELLEKHDVLRNPLSRTNYFMAWLTLGMVKIERNEWQDAVSCLEQSLEVANSLENSYMTLFPFANLADVYANLGGEYLNDAISASQSALEISQEFRDRYQEFSLFCQLGFLQKEASAFDQAIAHFDSGFALVDEVRKELPDVQTKANFMATVTEEYANAVLTAIECDDTEKAFNYVEQARGRVFLELLDAGSGDAHRSQSLLDCQTIQQSLPPECMILSYYTTGVIESSTARHTQDKDVRRVRFPAEKTLIFTITRDDMQVFDTGLNPNQIIPGKLKEAIETYFLRDGMRKFLHSFLIRPVQHLIQGKKRVFICPHGPLHFVPFHTLVDITDMPLLTDDGPEIIYAPSATVLVRDARQYHAEKVIDKGQGAKTINGCLAVGFDGIVDKATGKIVAGLAPLAHAETEATSIARITDGKALIGTEPIKERLLALAPDYRYLHFSCHGIFKPDEPMESTLYIGRNEELTASDVVKMPRLNCRLVTLSACETGMNQVKRGDELYGFARAFFQAGAKAIVATQWRVDERTTRIFAEKFVDELRYGADVATAFKDAQLALCNITKAELVAYIDRFDEETTHGNLKGQQFQLNRPRNAEYHETMPPVELLVNDATDEQRILANYPFYWAPYILIGDPDL